MGGPSQARANVLSHAAMSKREWCAVLGIVLIVMAGSAFAFRRDVAGERAFWLGALVPHALLAAAVAYWAYREELLVDWFRPRGGDMFVGLIMALVLFGGAWAFTHYVTPAGTPKERWLIRLYLQLGSPTIMRQHLGMTFGALALAALCEELVWRGAVLYWLEAQFGSRRAWIVAAVLYAVAHLPTVWHLRDPQLGMNPILVLAALGAGLVWGGSTRVLGRITPAIFAHFLFDWMIVIQFRLWGPSA
jgi:uncharacterized protein